MRSISRTARAATELRVGWREWAAFPDFGVRRIKAKIDTGAKTSAVHAFEIRDKGGNVEFFLHPEQGKRLPEVCCRANVADRRRIRSSNGVVEERLIIRTHLVLGGARRLIELSLTNRDEMGFRLLLGRDALEGVLIDPSASFLLGKPPSDKRR